MNEQEPNAIPLAPEDAADLSMAADMFNASPDGKALTQKALDQLPDATIEINGYPT